VLAPSVEPAYPRLPTVPFGESQPIRGPARVARDVGTSVADGDVPTGVRESQSLEKRKGLFA